MKFSKSVVKAKSHNCSAGLLIRTSIHSIYLEHPKVRIHAQHVHQLGQAEAYYWYKVTEGGPTRKLTDIKKKKG